MMQQNVLLRSTPFRALLAFASLVPLLVAAWHGFDVIYIGEALRSIDGRPYFYTDHPGYTYTLVLAAWLKALSWLNAIPHPGLAAAIAAPSIDPYMQAMVWGGRLLSGALASGFAAAALVRLGGASRVATALFALNRDRAVFVD